MGIDLGTSGLKAIIIDESGSIKAVSKVDYNFDSPRQGYADQNPEDWWDYCCRAVKEALSRCVGQVVTALSFSGQMHGLVTLDAQMKPVRPAILHCDTRSGKQVEELRNTFGIDGVRDFMANGVYTGFLLPSLLWLRENEPENFERVRYVCLPKDYLRFKLTGELLTDYSDASGTLAFDIEELCWSGQILNRLSLPLNLFPQCLESTDLSGYVSPEAAKATGLPAGVNVVAGGGDQVMQGIGNGLLFPGDASVNIGSSGQVSFQIDRPVINPELNTNTFCGYKKGRWILLGATMTAGLSLKWWNSILGSVDFSELDDEVSSLSPGSGGLVFLPYLNGERTPHVDPDLSALFLGPNMQTSRAHMTRSVMEGVAFSLYQAMEICASLGYRAESLVASGGGARGRSWLQIQSDIFNLPIKVATIEEQAGLGAAICAGVGMKVYSDLEEGCRAVVRYRDEVVFPDKENHMKYRDYYECYKDAYTSNKEILSRLNRLRSS
jgi:xylulokinase